MGINKLNNKALSLGNSGLPLQKDVAKKVNEIIEYTNPVILVEAPTVVWDMAKGCNARITLTSNRYLEIRNAKPGDYGTLEIIQDGTGNRLLFLDNTICKVAGGGGALALTATGGATDITTVYFNGINYYFVLATNFG